MPSSVREKRSSNTFSPILEAERLFPANGEEPKSTFFALNPSRSAKNNTGIPLGVKMTGIFPEVIFAIRSAHRSFRMALLRIAR